MKIINPEDLKTLRETKLHRVVIAPNGEILAESKGVNCYKWLMHQFKEGKPSASMRDDLFLGKEVNLNYKCGTVEIVTIYKPAK